MIGPYNTSDYPITIVVVSLINIVVPLLPPYFYYCAPQNPIWIRLVALERGHRRLLQVTILELKDPQVQIYNHFKIELLKSRKSKMRKFDGKDSVNWILQMEQYFDLHRVRLLQKVCIASSYLESDQFLWYKGLCSRKKLVTWVLLITIRGQTSSIGD